MDCMFVTLDVSKVRGWLSAIVLCAESRKEGILCGTGCGPEGGRRRASAGQAACRGGGQGRLD